MGALSAEEARQRRATIASNLVLEALAAEIVQALRAAGQRSILLKGVTTARWLYEDGARAYSDVDLLVEPAGFDEGERVLRSLGFTRSPIEEVFSDGRPSHASTWGRKSAVVDLHKTLVGLDVSAQRAWTVLSASTEVWEVGNADVDVLNGPARALVLALHAAQHGPVFAHTRDDLERAVARLPPSVWVEVAGLARDLGAESSMAAGLQSVDAGELCASLRLPLEGVATVEGSASFHVAQGLLWLAQEKGLRRKLRFVWRKVFPPPALMRARMGAPSAGRTSLATAYALRLVRSARHVPRATWALLKMRRKRRNC